MGDGNFPTPHLGTPVTYNIMGKVKNMHCTGFGDGSPTECSENPTGKINAVSQLWKRLNAEILQKTEINFIEKFDKKVKFSMYLNVFW